MRTPLATLVAAQALTVAGRPTSWPSRSRWPVPRTAEKASRPVVVPDAPGLRGAVLAGEGLDQVEGVCVALAGAVVSDVAADQDQVDVCQVPAVVQQLRQHNPGVDTLGVGARVPGDVQV